MSMQIKFDDDYNETTFYFGTVIFPNRKDSGDYRFTVSVVYFSNLKIILLMKLYGMKDLQITKIKLNKELQIW